MTAPVLEKGDGQPDDRLEKALWELTYHVGNAVEGVCSYGLTIGEAYVPFDPDDEDDCEPEEVTCTQLWVRVTDVQAEASDSFDMGGCGASMNIGIEVGILRCIEIPEDGEAPTASDVMAAAVQSMVDMKAIFCAAMSLEVWDKLTANGWQPNGPLGGQYGGVWQFTARLI